MQWRWIEVGEEIGSASTAECSGIWPDTAEIERRSEEECRRHQKIRETSKPLAGLPK